MGTRPVRVANCSGARGDPGYQMRRQATQGDVDFITGDYLAEMNLAENAEKMHAGQHDGWEPTAWDGLQQTLDVLDEKRIKVVINGGSLNPKGLAEKCQKLVTEKGYNLKVGYVSGDNLLEETRSEIARTGRLPPHLDEENNEVTLNEHAKDLLETTKKPIVSSNAYLGARAIVAGLHAGADIIICGRVADASPVIGAAWFWHDWKDANYDALAGALVAGHLVECSAYVTGSNFSGFDEYAEDLLIDLPFGIAEIATDGTCIIIMHDTGKGIVNEDTVKCQFLYELQGTTYLNSDVTADLTHTTIQSVGKNRVKVSGIRGRPPPPTTKLAIFYRGGYESQILLNATGYATTAKWSLYEKQLRYALSAAGIAESAFQVLDFQVIGTPAPNPRTQFSSTTYCRIFAQAATQEPLFTLLRAFSEYGMQHVRTPILMLGEHTPEILPHTDKPSPVLGLPPQPRHPHRAPAPLPRLLSRTLASIRPQRNIHPPPHLRHRLPHPPRRPPTHLLPPLSPPRILRHAPPHRPLHPPPHGPYPPWRRRPRPLGR